MMRNCVRMNTSEASPQTNAHVGSASLGLRPLPRLYHPTTLRNACLGGWLRRGVEYLTQSVGLSGVKLSRFAGVSSLVLVQVAVVACDKMPLMAPSSSSVTVTSAARVLPAGGTTEVTAFVAESSGTPVQNGTVVRFTATLGRVDPVEAQTRNGLALTTFLAGDLSGIADVRATSGNTGGATGGTGTNSTTNVVQITVGAAAVGTVTVRANPGFIPFAGGTVEIIATVLTTEGRTLSGIPVTFSTTEGQLSAGSAVTDGAGEARTRLTTTRAATVTARAGTKDGAIAIVRREAPPIVTITMVVGTPPDSTALGQLWTFTATVVVTGGETNESRPVSYKWDFGDDSELTTNGNVATHIYTTGNVLRTVTVEVTMSDNQRASTSADIMVAKLKLP